MPDILGERERPLEKGSSVSVSDRGMFNMLTTIIIAYNLVPQGKVLTVP